MTKQEIVNIVSEATGLTKVETETVMNGIMGTIIESLANNDRVELRGFGSFGIKYRMPKKARIQEQEKQCIFLNDMYQLLNRVS